MSLQEFLSRNPSLSEILDYVNREAARVVAEKKTGNLEEANAKVS